MDWLFLLLLLMVVMVVVVVDLFGFGFLNLISHSSVCMSSMSDKASNMTSSLLSGSLGVRVKY